VYREFKDINEFMEELRRLLSHDWEKSTPEKLNSDRAEKTMNRGGEKFGEKAERL